MVLFQSITQTYSMNIKSCQNATESPKIELGEIDTSAPFQSVRDAVNLFGEGAFSGEKPSDKKAKSHSAEKGLARETQLHLAQKELNKLQAQIKNAETTKSQALEELEKARKAADDLSSKLKSITESKESALKDTEAAKAQANRLEVNNNDIAVRTNGVWKQDLEAARGQYISATTELDAAKQELVDFRQDCDASLEAQVAAFRQVAEAEHATKANLEKAGQLSKELAIVQESIRHVKLATLQAQEGQAKIYAEKDLQRQSHKGSLEKTAKKLLDLKMEFDPEVARSLEVQLLDAVAKIGSLQKDMEYAKASDLDSVRSVTVDLDDAKGSLQKVAEEESSLRRLVETLKQELETVKKEHAELKEKEAETESIAGSLHVKLRKSKSELEACLAEESKARGASDELISTVHQLSSETETARQEAEELKKKAEELKKEAEATRSALEEADKQLRVAMDEAEQAKAAEKRALDQIKILSERTSAARASTSESGANITISTEEFESLSHKVEESDLLAEMKVAAAKAQVEAVKASENEALKRLEATLKDVADMKMATEEALKRAEMAEAAKRVVEGELRRWREREQKKAAETASRILAETKMSSETSPQQYRYQKQVTPQKRTQIKKLEKEKFSVSRKALLPNLSGIFHRKKNQVEGASPSYLPGEKYV